MEHIIQFGVSIDEGKIIDVATGKAAAEIISRLNKEIDEYTRGWQETKLERLFREEIKKVIDENKDKIIEDATAKLASNMAKTKAVKEMIAKMEV